MAVLGIFAPALGRVVAVALLMPVQSTLLHHFAFALKVLQAHLDVVLFDDVIKTLSHLLLHLLKILAFLLVSAIAEFNSLSAICILPVFLVILAVKVDEKQRMPEHDEAITRV